MTFSVAIRADLHTSSSDRHYGSGVCPLTLEKRSAFAIPRWRGRGNFKLTVSSVLGNSINNNGAAEPTQILLESLFSQTQKMEERMSQDSGLTEGIQDGINLENLECELRGTLVVLKKKEQALHDAERIVLLEHTELECTKEDLERREKEIDVIAYKQQELEDALKDANLDIESKTMQIEELKLQINERDRCIAFAQSVLDTKQRDLDITRKDLVAKNEELSRKNFELATKALILEEADEVIKKQDVEIQELHKIVLEKQQELEVLLELHVQDEEKLKIAEHNLKSRTMEYLVAHEKMNKLAEETSFKETNETLAEFGRVKRLLADVRSELVVSQKSLSLSRENMKSRELLMEGQFAELEEQKACIMSYTRSLKDAYVVVESEGVQFRVALARSKELEDELAVKKRLIHKLEDDLKSENVRLEQALQDKWLLKEELDNKCREMEAAHTAMQHKDSELMIAKLEIQHLQSHTSSLNQILSEKDSELLRASERLKEMTSEVVELKTLVSSKEDQIVQTINMLKGKDSHLQVMQHELNDSKLKYADAGNAIQRIVDLTNELITSAKSNSEVEVLKHSSGTLFRKSKLETKQVEAEMALASEKLRTREMEVLASQSALAIKNEELNLVCEKQDLKKIELNTAKKVIAQEADELQKLHALSQERIDEKTIGELAIDQLQPDVAQREAEAATIALTKLADLSRVLGSTPSWFSQADFTTGITAENMLEPACSGGSTGDNLNDPVDLSGVRTEVARLVSLTEELINEAGIGGCTWNNI